MSEIIREPELTRLIRDMDSQGVDPIALLVPVEGGARWLEEEPEVKAAPLGCKEITPRDAEILEMEVDGFDCVQVVLSRLEPKYDGYERVTYKTAHLSVNAVKRYLGRAPWAP